ncbi:hypothetical protein DFJ58DRAFT_848381 [Suillus subalutaceus]|uniref:uncharacterized protein n=1 Tax=Suillus subalutaceus TaxID=48586 RepID=UPI001B85D67E|nr:uncharacterized protein DFJ58DRAFT_848381 [Suillus subalutaceus]KAG1830728.1 hypothetical protein DFJ58DRAFT_848381 [Suillus subalutaceus]
MSSDWTHSFKAILKRSRVIKKIRKAIVAAHKEQGSKVTLPSSLKKAIKQYYADEVEVEESDGEEATKEREISARPKEASFYKKKLTDWDVAQKCRASKKSYCKNNLKKVLEEFSEQLRRSMGCHVVMLVSHKKRVDQTLNVTLHESVPQNVKKASLSAQTVSESGLQMALSFLESGQRRNFTQQLLQAMKKRMNMNYQQSSLTKKAMHNFLLMRYLEAGSVPDDLIICDPSHMRAKDINTIWHYWERRSMAQKRLVTFTKARSCDMRINAVNSANVKASSKKDKPYIEVGSEADEQHSSAGLDTTLAVSSPAEVPRGHRFEFLDALSSDRSYLELVDAVKDLATITENLPTPEEQLNLPPWVNWSSKESYLPASEHMYLDSVIGSLDLLTEAPIQSAYSAALVVLGLGLLLRDCKRVMEYEEDEAHPDAPYYLPISVLDLQIILKVDSAISHVTGTVVGLIELAMRAGLPDNSDQEEEMQGANGEKDQEDEQEVVMGDVNVQMQEVEKDHEQEGKQKGKKRTRSQTSQVKTKKARTEDEPMRRSTRTRQPSKKNMRP